MKLPRATRHVVTDTSGLLVGVVVHPADIQDRDGAGIVIQAIHDLFPWLRHLFADSVYNGPNLRRALTKFGDWTIEIVTRATGVAGFHLLPRRWVVERTLAWLNRNRRLARTSRPQSPAPQLGSTSLPHSFSSGDCWTHSTTHPILIQTLRQVGKIRISNLTIVLKTGSHGYSGHGVVSRYSLRDWTKGRINLSSSGVFLNFSTLPNITRSATCPITAGRSLLKQQACG